MMIGYQDEKIDYITNVSLINIPLVWSAQETREQDLNHTCLFS